jgi:hypothetical protein
VLLLLFACSGSPEATPETPEPTVVEHGRLDPAQLLQAERALVAPSAEETRMAVEKAGLGSLGALVPERHYKLDIPDPDRVALRTGVLLADTVLTVRDAPPEEVIKRLKDVQTGMTTLGADPRVISTLGELAGQLENDAIDREDLLKTLDEATASAQDDLGEHGRFVQAGAWLSGSNLVAQAVLAKGDATHAGLLLKQPDVASYYLDYVRSEDGKKKAGADIAAALEDTLETLLTISEKDGLELADVEVIQKKTGDILDLI